MLGRSRRATGAPEVRAVKMASATATAALATNARRQCTVASSPPISGASESAPVCTLAKVPTARVRCCGGTISASVASRSGVRNAFEAPWTTRAATKIVSVGAAAAISEPMA